MKKIISAVAALSLILSCFCVIGVRAVEEPTIYYSVDKSKWYELPSSNFTGEADIAFADGTQKTAKVYMQNGRAALDLADKTQFIYLYAEAPDGAECDFYTTIDVSQNLDPWKNLVDGGEWAWNRESAYAKFPVKVSDSVNSGKGPLTAVSVPLRLGRVDIYLDCRESGASTLYKTSVNGVWTQAANSPQISNLHDDFRVYTGDAAGYPILMNGASVANDNQMYLFTYSKYRVPGASTGLNWDGKEIWTGANFSKWLEGSSYVMMPGLGIAKNHAHYNDKDVKFFDLSFEKTYSASSGDVTVDGGYSDGYIGEVVVLMPNRADKDSVYYKDPEWECVNSGTVPKVGDNDFSPASVARNFNNYTSGAADDERGKYYGAAIKWKNSGGYRESSPGVSGSLSSSNYDDIRDLKYAYRRKISAGDTVSIYSPANIDGDNESYGLIIPVIKYYMPDEKVDIKNVEAKYLESGDGVPTSGAVAVNVTTLLENYTYGRTVNATYALYDDNGILADVETKSQEASTTSDEFIFACAKDRAKFLNVVFTNDAGAVIATKTAPINP